VANSSCVTKLRAPLVVMRARSRLTASGRRELSPAGLGRPSRPARSSIRHQIIIAAQNRLDVQCGREPRYWHPPAPTDNTHSDQLFSTFPIRDAIDGDVLNVVTTSLLSDFLPAPAAANRAIESRVFCHSGFSPAYLEALAISCSKWPVS